MTSVKLVKDCGLYPSYKKIIDFKGTKEEIIQKQLTWLDTFEHNDYFDNVNYNKFQNRLVLPIIYEEAITYTYCVLSDINGSGDKPLFFFISDVENLSNSLEVEPSIAFDLTLDPVMSFMGEWELDDCLINKAHVDRWNPNGKIKRVTPNVEGVNANYVMNTSKQLKKTTDRLAVLTLCFTSPRMKWRMNVPLPSGSERTFEAELSTAVYYGYIVVNLDNIDESLYFKATGTYHSIQDTTYPMELVSHMTGTFKFPSYREVVDGFFQSTLPIADDAIVSFNMVSGSYLDYDMTIEDGKKIISFTNPCNQELYFYNKGGDEWKFSIDDPETLGFVLNTRSNDGIETLDVRLNQSGGNVFPDYMGMMVRTPNQLLNDYVTLDIPREDWFLPVMPTDGDINSSEHEPALYMAPYVSRRIVQSDGTNVGEIPDVNIEENKITIATIQSTGGISAMFVQGSDGIDNVLKYSGEGCSFNHQAVQLDIISDSWKNYVYTKRDTDRQIASNYIMKNALDNLFFMSYGGALVGSRSAGKEGLFKPTDSTWDRKGTVGVPNTKINVLEMPVRTQHYGLTNTGRRVVGATGLASLASIATSLIDAHYMWDNQMLKEKQIRNESTTVTNIGDSAQSVLLGLKDYYFISLKVDDVNWDKAYNNFRKYGYFVNKIDKPNIQSRKYFNYILTNGAIVKGSLAQSIRDVIAAIFDSGVTIFHYDSNDETTRRLEYTDKENIEVSLL